VLDALAALIKALLYAGVLSGAGAVFAETTIRPSGEAARFLIGVMRRGALLTIAAGIASAILLILRLGGDFDEATLSAVFFTSSGAGLGLQIAGAVLLLTADSDDATGTGRAMRLTNAALMTASFVFSGHAGAMGAADGLVAFAHVSAAAWWLGSLWLLRYVCAAPDRAVVNALVQRFSKVAAVLIGALIMAGVVLIVMLVDLDEDPWFTPWLAILVVKLGVAATVLGLAAYNRYRLTPRLLQGETVALSSLRRMIRAELILIGAILAVTAILTTYVSPHD
jgi:putative copper export protein